MTFREREAARIFRGRVNYFSEAASRSLERDHHRLDSGFERENVFIGFRDSALSFFEERRIKWHGAGACDRSIVSSQVACLNCFFPFVDDPSMLERFLIKLYPDLQQALQITADCEQPLPLFGQPCITFEWIGTRNFLGERRWGSRGQNCTSVDVLFRFRTVYGKIHLVLAEWKYCERYASKSKYIRYSPRGTDRVAIYRPHVARAGSQIQLNGVAFEDLFFEPFDQLMRLQLLASEMERERELGADIVSVLHLAPRANEGLINHTLTSRISEGSTLGEVWSNIAAPGRFKAVFVEDIIPWLVEGARDREWANYIEGRYGQMA